MRIFLIRIGFLSVAPELVEIPGRIRYKKIGDEALKDMLKSLEVSNMFEDCRGVFTEIKRREASRLPEFYSI